MKRRWATRLAWKKASCVAGEGGTMPRRLRRGAGPNSGDLEVQDGQTVHARPFPGNVSPKSDCQGPSMPVDVPLSQLSPPMSFASAHAAWGVPDVPSLTARCKSLIPGTWAVEIVPRSRGGGAAAAAAAPAGHNGHQTAESRKPGGWF